jgi:AMMECR1 domain-containing protein
VTPPEVALAAIRARLEGASFTPPGGGEIAAAVVTLRAADGVRSVGTTNPDAPLPALVARLAVLAAFDDPRHVPLTSLRDVAVEVAVLGPPRRVRSPADLDPARDAVSIRSGIRSATLLPMARGWDAPTVLAVLCRRAGLPRAAWEDPQTVLEARRVLGPGDAPRP